MPTDTPERGLESLIYQHMAGTGGDAAAAPTDHDRKLAASTNAAARFSHAWNPRTAMSSPDHIRATWYAREKKGWL